MNTVSLNGAEGTCGAAEMSSEESLAPPPRLRNDGESQIKSGILNQKLT